MLPPEMMEASQIHRELVLLGDLLRLIEQMQGFTQAFADPKTFSQADLRSAASDVIRRCFYGFAVREHRRSSISEVPFELSLQANERMTIRGISGNLAPSSGQAECRIHVVA